MLCSFVFQNRFSKQPTTKTNSLLHILLLGSGLAGSLHICQTLQQPAHGPHPYLSSTVKYAKTVRRPSFSRRQCGSIWQVMRANAVSREDRSIRWPAAAPRSKQTVATLCKLASFDELFASVLAPSPNRLGCWPQNRPADLHFGQSKYTCDTVHILKVDHRVARLSFRLFGDHASSQAVL